MSYTWSAKTLQNSNIVQSREFDVALDNFADTFNGGIDRENLPINFINLRDPARAAPGNSGKHWIIANCVPDPANLNGDARFALGANNPRGNFIIGFRYDSDLINGGGGISYWKAGQITGVEEGMMTLTYTQSSYIPKYWTYFYASGVGPNTVAKKAFKIYIRYNGVVVFEGDYEYHMWMTRTHTATFPVPTGTGLIEVGVEVLPQKQDADDQVILSFVGGQIHAFNRRR